MTSHYSNEKYHQLNSQLSESLFQGRYLVRAYQNASLAAYDVAMGLQQYLSHKNHLGVVKNGSSLIENLTPHWLRAATPMQTKTETQTWTEYIESLNSETNFVMWASENEITGEVLVSEKEVQEIHDRLAKKRIFSIQITHRATEEIVLANYSILIVRNSILSDDSCAVVMTDKMKALSLIGAYQDLNGAQIKSLSGQEDELLLNLVEKKFETKMLYLHQYAMIPPRVTDRVVFHFKDLSGAALQEELGLTDFHCFAPSRYPFWVLQSWKNWWKESESEILLRGLCIISLDAFIKDDDLTLKIPNAVEKIRRLSQWNVLP
ncbi:MAG: hypothetical protein H7061_08300 [Bdellovibrionaceae bacterium]|nr:hypothetical protein [Bdellovibrio sp.]